MSTSTDDAGIAVPPATAIPGTDAPSLLVRSGNLFFRYRDAVSPAVFFLLLLLTRPHPPLGSRTLDVRLDVLGVLVSLCGQLLRIAVVGYAYIIRGGKGRKVYAEDLVTAGFFATSRNPLYLGNLLIYFGLFLMWNSPLMYAIGVPFFLFLYASIVAAEEDFLRRKFGTAYDAYCEDVGRWIPDVRRLGAALEGMAFNWRRVILKEYGTTTAWLLTASLLLLAETAYFSSLSAEPTRVKAVATFAVAVVSLWGTTRWLKLSRRMRV
jgi:protein-S-isoprenylcysteine O-methyltransferase Ste14